MQANVASFAARCFPSKILFNSVMCPTLINRLLLNSLSILVEYTRRVDKKNSLLLFIVKFG